MITLIPNSWGSVLLEDNDCHLPAGSSEGGQFCSGWRPSMTREEADEWAKDSLVQEIGTVVVRRANAKDIAAQGFSLTQRSGGRVWGDAVYVGLEPESEKFYRNMKGYRGPLTTLEVKVNVRRPLVLRASADTLSIKGWEKRVQSKITHFFSSPFPDNLTGLLARLGISLGDLDETEAIQRAGYDSLVILGSPDIETSAENVMNRWQGVGYAQVVVFDPKNVTVVGERGPYAKGAS